MATIRDVAKASGVSTATVSNVFNDSDRPVNARTRQRVLDAAHRLNYHPSAVARTLQGRPLCTIGVLFGVIEPEVITNPYASLILRGILTAAARHGYHVSIATRRWESATLSAAAYRDRRADGYIVVAPALDSDMVAGLHATGQPIVVISSQAVPQDVPFVDVDNALGIRRATEHMIALGHTRIAHISGDEGQPSVAARRTGFEETMAEAGLHVPPEYIVTSKYMIKESMDDSRALLTLPNPPTAIVTGSDNIALGILEVAKELGLSIPRDLSVTGFDDLPLAELVVPSLTTVRQPLAELGERAAQMLLNQIEDEKKAVSFLAQPELIVRASTGPPLPR